MTNLVVMKDKQAVTTSLNVAEGFEKQHKHVIEAIESKFQSAENSAHYKSMFAEGVYQDSRNRNQKMYYMNRDGFTFIAMGFTGSKADEFKLKYIQAFNQMEQHIQGNQLPMSQEDIMIATLEAQKEFKANLRLVQDDVTDLKQEINLNRLQKSHLSKLVRANAMAAVGGKRSNAYKKLYRVAISEHWREIKNYFDVASYEEIPKLRFDDAMDIAGMWNPSIELSYEIKRLNSQVELEV